MRFSVSAPPLPKVSYRRLMPLCRPARNIRYPGLHVSKVPCVNAPGIPKSCICCTLFHPSIAHSSASIGSIQGL